MRRSLLILAALLAGAAAFAQPMHAGPSPLGGMGGLFAADPLGLGLEVVSAELGDRKLGDLDGPALAELGKKLRMAGLERAYIQHAAAMSFMMPGAGQIATGDVGTGAAYLVSHLAVVAGSLVGSYFLLPADLRFDRLDYLASPIASINTAWDSHSILEYLPSFGIMAAGMLVDMPLRFFSSRNAASDARAAIKAGKVDLEARFGPGFAGWQLRY
ncbi:MAG TPA: hypothetical protein VMV44_15715 [Rectinemataceae bacterium]|nr:hypothetical protein [Rectinemataceae bacterium]